MPKKTADNQPLPLVRLEPCRTPRIRVAHKNVGPSRTKQSMTTDCDINAIMRKHAATGVLPPANPLDGSYGDFSNAEDYHAAINRVQAAQANFDALPADIRALCDNDPAELLDITSNPARADDLGELQSMLGYVEVEPQPTDGPAVPAEPIAESDPAATEA